MCNFFNVKIASHLFFYRWSAVDYPRMGYDGGSGVRTTVADLAMTASDEPPNFTIEPHQEMVNLLTY